MLVKTLLVREGFEVDVAEDGAEAVNKSGRVVYDAVRGRKVGPKDECIPPSRIIEIADGIRARHRCQGRGPERRLDK